MQTRLIGVRNASRHVRGAAAVLQWRDGQRTLDRLVVAVTRTTARIAAARRPARRSARCSTAARPGARRQRRAGAGAARSWRSRRPATVWRGCWPPCRAGCGSTSSSPRPTSGSPSTTRTTSRRPCCWCSSVPGGHRGRALGQAPAGAGLSPLGLPRRRALRGRDGQHRPLEPGRGGHGRRIPHRRRPRRGLLPLGRRTGARPRGWPCSTTTVSSRRTATTATSTAPASRSTSTSRSRCAAPPG